MTLQEAAEALADKLHDGSAGMVLQCKQWLQDTRYLMLNEINEWSFLEAEGEVATVVGQQDYVFATDFGNADLRKLSSLKDSSGRIIRLVPVEIIEQKVGDSSGTPIVAAAWAGVLKLWPVPSAVETLTWKGYTRVADLGDSDEPEWERTFDPVWRLGAEAMGLEYLDDQRAGQKWAIFMATLTKMFGSDMIEDEEIELRPWSRGTVGHIFMDDSGTVWP